MNSEASIEKSVSIRRHFHFPAFLVALSSAFFIFGTARLSAAFVLLVQAVIFFLVYVLICRNGVFPKKKASVFEIFYLLLLTLTGYSCQIVSLEELYPSIVQKEAEILPAFPFSVLGVILWLGSMPFLFWGWRWIFSWILPDLKRFFTSFEHAFFASPCASKQNTLHFQQFYYQKEAPYDSHRKRPAHHPRPAESLF